MCNLPTAQDIYDTVGDLALAPLKVGAEVLGIPTMPELTGAAEAAKLRKEQRAEFERQQTLAEEERRGAAEKLARGAASTGRGRASTMLTGPSGLLDDGTSARRMLMAG